MSADRFKPLLDREFLKAELHYAFEDYVASGGDSSLRSRLEDWAARKVVRETQAEGSFIQRFFVETWGYRDDGTGTAHFQLHPKFGIAGAGQGGNRGEADLAIGQFGDGMPAIPQVVCEFKDIKSGLDASQNRKGNNRSPVVQAHDYLRYARRALFGNEPVQPRFAIVTDMNEFRLYWWDHFPDRYLRFSITGGDLFSPVTLLGDGDEALFDRFLFQHLFRPDMLLSDAGRTRLERLIEKQGRAEQRLEDAFYSHYRAYRTVLVDLIMLQRPDGVTKGGAVRLAQKLLDRLIFVMFAEDMGGRVGFPAGALQEELKRQSRDQFLEPEGDEVWRRLKRIFEIMNIGGKLGEASIHQFNGGLFATDAALDALTLPNRIFVAFGQAQNDAKLAEHPQTLLFLAATYNFAREGDAKNSIGLYTLGHIFEQSIVELEKLEADAEGRTSLTDVTKRKRDGVYYTPEWAVGRIIDETIQPLLARWRAEAGWPETGEPSRTAAAAYWNRLRAIRVLDPACGSGAFLIVALKMLERVFADTLAAAYRAGAVASLPDDAAITQMILANNLFGVDINPASVEITKLSLWLHTALPNKPLSGLDATIRCGNSLVDRRFYNKRTILDEDERDRINVFDWEGDFSAGSFDAVIGNPPYVKLQNFKRVNADMAQWLVSGSSGEAPYASTGTGNFDLYLPFIERGLSLLNEGGRMGYIAPNLWPTLDYGAGLRALIAKGGHLEKWIDFRSWQVFEEATVYTAIQIFSKAAVPAIRMAFVGDGDLSRVDWDDDALVLPYADIARPGDPWLIARPGDPWLIARPGDPWLIAPAPVRRMIERLGREAVRLDQPENVRAIFQGIITSADHIFHLRRLGRDRYAYTPRVKGKKQAAVVVAIEDAIMKRLVSGAEAKRFIKPLPETRLLFPYRVDAKGARLMTPGEMAETYPKAWVYLRGFEEELRARDSGKTDSDAKWFGYVYPKNLDKQEVPKLLVPRLVSRLGCFVDIDGRFYCDNVDVGGVVPARAEDVWLLAGVLNAPVTNMIFEWLSKPFRGDYKSANKQFIAPLPIPHADRASRAALSALAMRLQEQHTDRVRQRAALDERLRSTARARWSLDRLLPGVRALTMIEQAVPTSVPASGHKAWVDDERRADEEAALAGIDAVLTVDSVLEVVLADGKLSFLADEQLVARVFVGPAEEALVAAQWRGVALDFGLRGRDDAKRLVERLRHVAVHAEPAIAAQIIAIGERLNDLGGRIAADEAELHELTCRLFALTPEERRLVEAGRS